MTDNRTRPFRRIRRKYTFIILALLSGIIGSIWIAIDRYTGAAIVVNSLGESNEYVFAIQSMIIGIIVSFLFALILWIPISMKPFTKFALKLKEGKLLDSKQLKQTQPDIDEKRQFSFLGQFIDPYYKGIRLPNKKMFLWLS
ncbi:MAG: hypothetical protein GNW80_17365, partial [Asgard group archaeon]|nr:hypothetical protein [Asgard group archaeon]